MTTSRIGPRRLANAFNRNAETVGARLDEFLRSGDPPSAAAVRKAIKRLLSTYSVLPRSVRKDKDVEHYVSTSKKLAKSVGRIRDVDTVASWTARLSEGKDKRSLTSDLKRLRADELKASVREANELKRADRPTLVAEEMVGRDCRKRMDKVENRLSRRVGKEFDEFLTTQEIEVMHALRKDSKGLRHVLEVAGDESAFLCRLKSIQDELGAIRDHDLVIDYLRRRGRLTGTRLLIREEIARRHARLEDFVAQNRGQGRLVPVKSAIAAHSR